MGGTGSRGDPAGLVFFFFRIHDDDDGCPSVDVIGQVGNNHRDRTCSFATLIVAVADDTVPRRTDGGKLFGGRRLSGNGRSVTMEGAAGEKRDESLVNADRQRYWGQWMRARRRGRFPGTLPVMTPGSVPKVQHATADVLGV